MSDPLSWILIVILVFLSLFFSIAETSYACCNQFRFRVAADEGKKSAKVVLKVLDNYDKSLITVLIGHNIVSVALSAISTVLFYNMTKGTGMEDYASILSTIVMTLIVFLFGDMIPKILGKKIPDTICTITAYPIYVLIIIFTPISLIFEGISWVFEKIFKLKDDVTLTEEDFTNVVESIEEEGQITEADSDIIQATLDFADTSVKEVLTPVRRMYSIDIDGLTNEELNKIILEKNFSRIPMYSKEKNNIIGVLLVKTYLRSYLKDHNIDIKTILQPTYFVTPQVKLDDLFKGFKEHKTHVAIVKNKDDKVIGMVTMEDVLEELVGEIAEPSSTLAGSKK